MTETPAVCDTDSTNDTFSDDALDDISDDLFDDSSTSCDTVDNTWECSDDECLELVWSKKGSGNRIVSLPFFCLPLMWLQLASNVLPMIGCHSWITVKPRRRKLTWLLPKCI
jgi:hypothetical protein